ncbi:hypothetical protein [Nocardia sp. NPDC057440]|uniref:hypothetical protein n=1 Tax=Nocardia sp. NPDC057440 TaxID=3346134 RepID=UPI0036720286
MISTPAATMAIRRFVGSASTPHGGRLGRDGASPEMLRAAKFWRTDSTHSAPTALRAPDLRTTPRPDLVAELGMIRTAAV